MRIKSTLSFSAEKAARPRADALREPFYSHTSSAAIRAFRQTIFKFYKQQGRHDLPWRKTHDPYKILVSEMMLQQTQVERVKPFYSAFIKQFPTVKALAAVPLADVLKAWQGLGYNSRGKRLQDAAKEIVTRYRGKFPMDAAILESLPGIGPYTAHAVATFAYNHDAVFIETNIRTVIQYHFFPRKKVVTDEEIFEVLKRALPRGNAREWYSALMDYGSHLKRSGIKLNSKSKAYKKQSTFTGSNRQARGAILRELTKGTQSSARLIHLLGDDRIDQMKIQLEKLSTEHLIQKQRGSRFQLPL